MRLGYLRETFPDIPLIACTATATTKVIDDIKKVLHLESSPCYIGSFDRPNIFYKVMYKDVIDADSIEGAQGHLIRFIEKQHERCAITNSKCSGIVYCHTRAETTDLANAIRKHTRIGTEAYHGGLKVHERNKVQLAWTSGESQIAVATVAFGMGIDLPHVRYVVHWNMAKSPEAFYQESGRAGRDGLPAYSILYYSKADVAKFQFLLSQRQTEGNTPPREMAGLELMKNYCVSAGCRRCILLKHFGEKVEDPKTICDGSCDYCVNPTKVEKLIEAADNADQFKFYTRQPQSHAAEPYDECNDDSVTEEFDTECDGLGITKSVPIEIDSISSHPKKSGPNFEKTSSILAKYEAVEMKSASFVTFKAKTDEKSKSDNVVRIPRHLIPEKTAIPKITMESVPQQRNSAHYSAEADRLRAEIDIRKAELEERRQSSVKR
jgi:RecQ family ATP-dependent DNA helicase